MVNGEAVGGVQADDDVGRVFILERHRRIIEAHAKCCYPLVNETCCSPAWATATAERNADFVLAEREMLKANCEQ